MPFDLRSLQHFITVAQSGGFASAARRLNLSQPTLSRSIAQLEQDVGATLFVRDPRGAAINDTGARFLPHAIAILNEVERARALFEDPEDADDHPVRLGVSPSLLHHDVPDALRDALAADPDCRVVVTTGTREVLTAALRAGELDVVVCLVDGLLTAARENFRGLRFEEVSSETIVPVAAAGHPILEGVPTMATVATHGWAVPHQLSVSYRFETAFFRRGLPNPPQRLNCASMALLRRAVCDWGLIGLVPSRLVDEDLAAGRMRILDLADLHFHYRVTILTAENIPLSASGDRLIGCVRRVIIPAGS